LTLPLGGCRFVAMARGWVHTVYSNGKWRNEIEEGQALLAHETKDAAVEAGSAEAQRLKTEHVIHNIDGTIAQQASYGHNPARHAAH
jgi:hypothetical protein